MHTEAVRLLRTNKRYETFDIQRWLFARLLGRRGHSQSTIWSILHRYPFVDKVNILSRLQRKKVRSSSEVRVEDSACKTSKNTVDACFEEAFASI